MPNASATSEPLADHPVSIRRGMGASLRLPTFNTTGPVVPADHYTIPPLDRTDPGYLLELIRAKNRAGTSQAGLP